VHPRPLSALALAVATATAARANDLIWSSTDAGDGARFGTVLVAIGDQDGDGFADVLATSPDERSGGALRAGAARVLSGLDGGTLATLTGDRTINERFGASATACGDLDGDGVQEFAVGAPGAGGNASGAVTIFRGGSFTAFDRIDGPSGSQLGAAIALLDDLDGDGRPDLVNGAAGVANGSQLGAGRVDAYGSATGAVLWSTENPWSGPSVVQQNFGFAVATTEDADGDGFREVWAGTPNVFRSFGTVANARTGAVFRLGGADGAPLDEIVVDRVQSFGFDVEAAGDVDGDGVGDVAVGALGGSAPGAAYALSGATRFPILEEVGDFDGFGFSVAGAGDLSGDGLAEIAAADFTLAITPNPPVVKLLGGPTLGLFGELHGSFGASSHRFGQGLAGLPGESPGAPASVVVADPFVGGPGEVALFGEGALGVAYCVATPNSSGAPAALSARGSIEAADNDVRLIASRLPAPTFAQFLTSALSDVSPAQFGNLCLGGAIGRYNAPGQVQAVGAGGLALLRIDLTRTPVGGFLVPTVAGETRHFQCWFRDSVGGVQGSNFTTGLEISFQ